MKKLIYSTFLLFLLSCHNNTTNSQSNDNNESSVEKAEKDKKVTKRDYSITKANAYNDLFLDSAAVAKFITTNNLNDTLTRRIRSFYNSRNYQFAWFSSKGLTEQAREFWNLHEYAVNYTNDNADLNDKALRKKMDGIVTAEDLSIKASDPSYINTELMLTQQFFQYILNNYEKGVIKRKEAEHFIPSKKRDAIYVADSILTKKHKDNKYYEDANDAYKKLKDQLQKYVDIAKRGGWPTIPADAKKLKKGVSSPLVKLVKKRMQITGELPASDTSVVFDDALVSAVKTFQTRLGYTANGQINEEFLKDLNVPVNQRVQQLLINMDRMRWIPNEPDGNLLLVNIPEFILHVYEGGKQVFQMPVVVGKEGHNTVSFTGKLNQVVFSPYWNVPPDIVKKEVLPSMQKDPNYLERNNMEQTGTEGGLPVIRQLPGPKNSLGQVKFLFPNDFNIYFHDTPAKALFSRDKRAYSHGCIRLSEPKKMAEYLLRNQPEWTSDKIDEAMNSGQEQYVKLKNSVPVLITYYTAWVDENGLLNFRDDIYSHDADLAQKMFVHPYSMSKGK